MSTDGVGVIVHRIGEDTPVTTLPTPPGQESKTGFSPDTGTLAVTSHSTVRLVDTGTWQIRSRLITGGEGEPLLSVAWSLDGSRVYAGTDARVYAWQTAPRTEHALAGAELLPGSVLDLPASDEPGVFGLAVLPGSGHVVATTFDGATYVLADDPLRIVEGPLQHDNVTLNLAADADGRRIAVAALNEATVWQVAGTPHGRPARGIPVPTDTIDLAFLPGGDLVTVGSGGQGTRWDLDAPSPVVAPLPDLGAGMPTFSPSGDLIAMAGWGQGVRLFDGRSLEPRVELESSSPERVSVAGLAFHPREEVIYLLSCSATDPGSRDYCPGELTAYDTRSGARVAGLVSGGMVPPWLPTLLAVSPDGNRLVTGRAGGVVKLHDPESLLTSAVLDDIAVSPDARFVIQVDFAPDGRPRPHGCGVVALLRLGPAPTDLPRAVVQGAGAAGLPVRHNRP